MYNLYIMQPDQTLTRTQIYLTQAQQKRLALASRGAAVTKSELIRRAVDQFLDQQPAASLLATLLNYFAAVSERWPNAWAFNGRGAVLSKTNGYNALIRFLRDAYLYLSPEPRLIRKNEFRALLDKSKLIDSDFTVDRFKPGSSGSADLYRELVSVFD